MRPVLVHVPQTGRVSSETGKWGWGVGGVVRCGVWGFVLCKVQERRGFPRRSLQCKQLHHIMSQSDP